VSEIEREREKKGRKKQSALANEQKRNGSREMVREWEYKAQVQTITDREKEGERKLN